MHRHSGMSLHHVDRSETTMTRARNHARQRHCLRCVGKELSSRQPLIPASVGRFGSSSALSSGMLVVYSDQQGVALDSANHVTTQDLITPPAALSTRCTVNNKANWEDSKARWGPEMQPRHLHCKSRITVQAAVCSSPTTKSLQGQHASCGRCTDISSKFGAVCAARSLHTKQVFRQSLQ